MEEGRLLRWKERCECACNNNNNNNSLSFGDFRLCDCSTAQQLGLLCPVCSVELVERLHNGSRFWSCSNYFDKHCRFTRPVDDDDDNRKRKRGAALVSPDNNGRQPNNNLSQGSSSDITLTTYSPRVLFAASTAPSLEKREMRLLQDTFIGETFANDIVKEGVPETVMLCKNLYYDDDDEKNENDNENPLLCCPKTKHPNELFCYFWNNNNKKQQPSSTRNSNKRPVVLDLFAGAGGMSQGLLHAGMCVKWAVEHDQCAFDTLRSNHKDTIVFHQDVYEFLEHVKKQPHLLKEHDAVDHVHASPPCQGFSKAKRSSMSSSGDKKKNELLHTFVEAVRLLQPATASLENVAGLMQSKHKAYLQKLVAELLVLNYHVRGMLLNSKDYGDPQERKRVILFAAKADSRIPLPEIPATTTTVMTNQEALQDLATIDPAPFGAPAVVRSANKKKRTSSRSGNQEEEKEETAAAVVFYDHHEMKMTVGCDLLEGNGVAGTVTRINRMVHHSLGRELTIRERARLQSFPDDYHFCGSPQEQCNQIGNAVPVCFATAIGESIMKAYNQGAQE